MGHKVGHATAIQHVVCAEQLQHTLLPAQHIQMLCCPLAVQTCREEAITFHQAAFTELQVVKTKAVRGSHSSSEGTADYQHIPPPGLLEYEAIEAGLSRRRLS